MRQQYQVGLTGPRWARLLVDAHAVTNQIVDNREARLHADPATRWEYLDAVVIGEWDDPVTELGIGQLANRLGLALGRAWDVDEYIDQVEISIDHHLSVTGYLSKLMHFAISSLS